MVQPLDENQGLSQLHGHGPWHVVKLPLMESPSCLKVLRNLTPK